jgi:hypothetical protein
MFGLTAATGFSGKSQLWLSIKQRCGENEAVSVHFHHIYRKGNNLLLKSKPAPFSRRHPAKKDFYSSVLATS